MTLIEALIQVGENPKMKFMEIWAERQNSDGAVRYHANAFILKRWRNGFPGFYTPIFYHDLPQKFRLTSLSCEADRKATIAHINLMIQGKA